MLIQTCRTIKAQGGLSDSTYKKTLSSWYPPNSMVFPKSINTVPPQAHHVQQGCSNIWSGQGAGQYHQTPGRPVPPPYQNTQCFIEQIKSLKQQHGECMVSYDVKALFTLVPMDPAISIVKCKC